MSEDQKKRVEISLKGRVQGVGFRHFTVTRARELNGVTGWVRNESDGSVTLVAEGPRQELDKLVSDVKEGPRRARVRDLDKTVKEPRNEFSSFEVRY